MAGTAEVYFPLSGNFTHQTEPAFCGLGSLAMVLNALEMDPRRRWRGVWRWYSEEMLECCAPLAEVRKKGITFQELLCLARCNGLEAHGKWIQNISKQEFLHDVKSVCSNADGKNRHMIVSFSRKSLGQTGDGHFSPIGAYHEKENRILVLDTARFKYPSYFAKADEIYNAMFPIDRETGQCRGYILVSRQETSQPSLCRIKSERINWKNMSRLIGQTLPQLFTTIQQDVSFESIVEHVLLLITKENELFIGLNPPGMDLAGEPRQSQTVLQGLEQDVLQLIKQTEKHPLHQLVRKVLLKSDSLREKLIIPHLSNILGLRPFFQSDLEGMEYRKDAVLATLFVLAIPLRIYQSLPESLFQEAKTFRGWSGDWRGSVDILRSEVSLLSRQLDHLINMQCQQCCENGCISH